MISSFALLVYQQVGRIGRREILLELLIGAFEGELAHSLVVEFQPGQWVGVLPTVEHVMAAEGVPAYVADEAQKLVAVERASNVAALQPFDLSVLLEAESFDVDQQSFGQFDHLLLHDSIGVDEFALIAGMVDLVCLFLRQLFLQIYGVDVATLIGVVGVTALLTCDGSPNGNFKYLLKSLQEVIPRFGLNQLHILLDAVEQCRKVLPTILLPLRIPEALRSERLDPIGSDTSSSVFQIHEQPLKFIEEVAAYVIAAVAGAILPTVLLYQLRKAPSSVESLQHRNHVAARTAIDYATEFALFQKILLALLEVLPVYLPHVLHCVMVLLIRQDCHGVVCYDLAAELPELGLQRVVGQDVGASQLYPKLHVVSLDEVKAEEEVVEVLRGKLNIANEPFHVQPGESLQLLLSGGRSLPEADKSRQHHFLVQLLESVEVGLPHQNKRQAVQQLQHLNRKAASRQLHKCTNKHFVGKASQLLALIYTVDGYVGQVLNSGRQVIAARKVPIAFSKYRHDEGVGVVPTELTVVVGFSTGACQCLAELVEIASLLPVGNGIYQCPIQQLVECAHIQLDLRLRQEQRQRLHAHPNLLHEPRRVLLDIDILQLQDVLLHHLLLLDETVELLPHVVPVT